MYDNIDFEWLRNDLMNEYGAQMVAATGLMGFSDMCEAKNASEEELIEIANREGISLEQYLI